MIWVTSKVYYLDSNRSFVVTISMGAYSIRVNPLFDLPIAINVNVACYTFSCFVRKPPCSGEIWFFGAVQHHHVNFTEISFSKFGIPGDQALFDFQESILS